MTEAELAEHEAHARAVDSRMSERVLALAAEVRRLHQQQEQDRIALDGYVSLVGTLNETNETLAAERDAALAEVERLMQERRGH